MEEKISPSSASHKKSAAKKGPIKIAVITVSDSRTPETDTNGQYLSREIQTSGNFLAAYYIVKDEPDEINKILDKLGEDEIHIILINGGTGISSRDTTFEVITRRYEKTLPGFGELFRWLSYEQVGSSAMLSRASAGIFKGKVIFSTPGSHAALQLAWQKLIAPEIQHLAWELQR
jgi:molybdopterin adenylyltransferase